MTAAQPAPTKPWWVSWYSTGIPFELHSPWWVSGLRLSDGADTICAAVRAESAEAARGLVIAAHDSPPAEVEWRFVEERPADWTPFTDRFPRADWMRW